MLRYNVFSFFKWHALYFNTIFSLIIINDLLAFFVKFFQTKMMALIKL